MGTGLNLDPWWDEPAYQASRETFIQRGTFILAKLQAHDPAKLKDVLADVYRDEVPDPQDITKFEWGPKGAKWTKFEKDATQSREGYPLP